MHRAMSFGLSGLVHIVYSTQENTIFLSITSIVGKRAWVEHTQWSLQDVLAFLSEPAVQFPEVLPGNHLGTKMWAIIVFLLTIELG